MARYEVTMGRGGSGRFVVTVNGATPDEARRTAETQNPGYVAQAVRRVN